MVLKWGWYWYWWRWCARWSLVVKMVLKWAWWWWWWWQDYSVSQDFSVFLLSTPSYWAERMWYHGDSASRKNYNWYPLSCPVCFVLSQWWTKYEWTIPYETKPLRTSTQKGLDIILQIWLAKGLPKRPARGSWAIISNASTRSPHGPITSQDGSGSGGAGLTAARSSQTKLNQKREWVWFLSSEDFMIFTDGVTECSSSSALLEETPVLASEKVIGL